MPGKFLSEDLHSIFATEEFASCAVYRRTGGQARNVTVIMDVPDESVPLAGVGVMAAVRVCLAQVCEFPEGPPDRGDNLTVRDAALDKDVAYTINKKAAREISGDLYSLELMARNG